MSYKQLPVGVLNLDTGETVTPQPWGNAGWAAYLAWFAAGGVPQAQDMPAVPAQTPAEIAAQAEIDARAAIVAALKSNTLMQALRTRTPAQIDTWVTNNVTDLASAINAIRLLAYVVALLARERLQ